MRKETRQNKTQCILVFSTVRLERNNPQEKQKNITTRHCKSAIPTEQSSYNQTKIISSLTLFLDTLESSVTNAQESFPDFEVVNENLSSYIFKVLSNTNNQNIIKVKIKEPNVKRH